MSITFEFQQYNFENVHNLQLSTVNSLENLNKLRMSTKHQNVPKNPSKLPGKCKKKSFYPSVFHSRQSGWQSAVSSASGAGEMGGGGEMGGEYCAGGRGADVEGVAMATRTHTTLPAPVS